MKPKLLVANRSEIACRVFQACREMGIATVALQAPGDEEARHLTYADEVVQVPSYLDIAAIVAAAKKVRATLVHPGYGFLSERPAFVRALEKEKITFVGPRAETMEALGEKIAAKEIAEKSGVPTLPWAKVANSAELKKVAPKLGFPLLLKASAGGGGKGMRRVDRAEDLESAAESAAAEAKAAFGDETLFVERLVENPRHIEMQVFGDGEGGAVHLYERECSLQRRHQKIWEEAPALNLSETTRRGLHESALNLVRAVKYRSAGTIEYLVDDKGGFYFLEMNTRLQVEHPVTEAITGVDLVHAQIELALGKSKLPTVGPARGHSIEVRLYAEDPAQGFIPSPGRVRRIHWPTGPGIRIDSGIEECQEITTLFDSMLAKIIVTAESRPKAIARLKYALEETAVLGVGTNQAYLHALCEHPTIQAGKMDTGFLAREMGRFTLAAQDTDFTVLAKIDADGIGLVGGSGASNTSGTTHSHPSPWFSGGGYS